MIPSAAAIAMDPLEIHRAGQRIAWIAEWLVDATVIPYSVTPTSKTFTVPPFEVDLVDGGLVMPSIGDSDSSEDDEDDEDEGELQVKIGCSAFLRLSFSDPMYGTVILVQSDVEACKKLLTSGAENRNRACFRIPAERCFPPGFCSAELSLDGDDLMNQLDLCLHLTVELRRSQPKETLESWRNFDRRFPPGGDLIIREQAREAIIAANSIDTARFAIDLLFDSPSVRN